MENVKKFLRGYFAYGSRSIDEAIILTIMAYPATFCAAVVRIDGFWYWIVAVVSVFLLIAGLGVIIGISYKEYAAISAAVKKPLKESICRLEYLEKRLHVSLIIPTAVSVLLYQQFGVPEVGRWVLRLVATPLGVALPSDVSTQLLYEKGAWMVPVRYLLEGMLVWWPVGLFVEWLLAPLVFLAIFPRGYAVPLLMGGSVPERYYATPQEVRAMRRKYSPYHTGAAVANHPPTPQQSKVAVAVPQAQQNSGDTGSEIKYHARAPKHDFDSIIGMESTKRGLLDIIEFFRKEGGNGILFAGDPGNGKSFMAEALAGELGWRFLEARANELTSQWVGETTQNVVQIFRDARAQAPVVMFIDEFDSFMTDRSEMRGGSAGQDARQTANAFLTAISDLNKDLFKHKVLIVAATNHLDQLDQAGIREGRFDQKIVIPAPDAAARRGILMSHLPKNAKINEDELKLVLRRWEGWSTSRIVNISKRAKTALENNPHQVVDAEFLRQMVDQLLQGRGSPLPEDLKPLASLSLSPAIKRRLERLVTMLREPEIVEQYGVRLPRGAVFYGPAGTGKTTMAMVLAKETGWRFLSASASRLLQHPHEMDKLVDQARDIRPCVVLLDEAEGLLRSRQSSMHPEVTNRLLSLMDGPQKLHDVFFVATTNDASDLDEAMVREGRFSEFFDFTPTDDALLLTVEAYMRERPQVRWVGTAQDLLERYPDMSQGNLQGLLNRAVLDAAFEAGPGEAPVVDLRRI